MKAWMRWVTARVPAEVLAIAAPLAVCSLLLGIGSALAFRPPALSASAVGPAPSASPTVSASPAPGASASPAPSPSETPYVEETPAPDATASPTPETGVGT
jgi:hypothetical protein